MYTIHWLVPSHVHGPMYDSKIVETRINMILVNLVILLTIFPLLTGVTLDTYLRGGSQRLFLTKVETMEFYFFYITQIVYVIFTFISIIISCSRAHIVHISTLASFKCWDI